MCREQMLEQFGQESNETSSPFRVLSAACVPPEHETVPEPMHADINRHFQAQLFCLSKM